MSELTLEPEEYSQLKRAFQGGFTHANARHVRQILSNVGSHDFTSSYPAVMVLEKFPMSKSSLVTTELNEKELEILFATKNCVFDFEAWGVIPKRFNEHPISRSKCKPIYGETVDNGRVVCCEYLKITITEQDYFTYNEFYDWDKCRISSLRTYEKQYLPRPFILSVLQLYQKKTMLKDVPEELVNYMISKNMINAAFGMTVTDIVRQSFEYLEDSYNKIPKDINGKIKHYNESPRRFLFYPWGVWVTAYARANLFSGIIELGDDYIYSDTDSLKSLNTSSHEKYFNMYNDGIIKKIQLSSEHNKIPIEMYAPKTIKGVVKTIGVWDDDGRYDSFKTLGAKRYLTYKDGKYVLTLAGANKKKAVEHLIKSGNPFKTFDNELTIPKESSGRLIVTYIDDHTHGVLVDCNGVAYEYDELSSVHMESSEYNLSMSEDFIKYMEEIQNIDE